MSYFLAAMPKPEPNMDDAAFWRNCAQRRLAFQACAACGALRHPPTPVCFKCRSTHTTWIQAPEQGEVFSFTVIHHAVHDAVVERVPYVVVSVCFPGLSGPRLVSNLTEVNPGAVKIGMPVELWWDDIGQDMHLPRFRPLNGFVAK